MDIRTFLLERYQSLHENQVKYNLGDSGGHPLSLNEVLDDDEIAELLKMAVSYGDTKGSEELRTAIANIYSCNIDNVLVTSGTSEANFLSIFTLLNPGDEIIYVTPNYLQIYGLAEAFGAVIKEVKLNDQFQINVEDIRKNLSNKTKIISICNPNNPTGKDCLADVKTEIVEIAKSVNAYLLIDEVYRCEQIFGSPKPSIYGIYDKIIINSSLSKAFGLPGLRLGWTIGPKEYIEQVYIRKDYTTISTNILSDFVARKLLSNKNKYEAVLQKIQKGHQESFEIFKKFAEEFSGIISWTAPEAGAMVYVKYNLPISSRDLMQKILIEEDVLIVAGEDYGMENYIRIGLGLLPDKLKIGLDRVAKVFRNLMNK